MGDGSDGVRLGHGLGLRFGFVEGDGLGGHQRAVVVFVFVVEVGGAEVNTGAALQGGEEGGGDVGAHPVGHHIQLLA